MCNVSYERLTQLKLVAPRARCRWIRIRFYGDRNVELSAEWSDGPDPQYASDSTCSSGAQDRRIRHSGSSSFRPNSGRCGDRRRDAGGRFPFCRVRMNPAPKRDSSLCAMSRLKPLPFRNNGSRNRCVLTPGPGSSKDHVRNSDCAWRDRAELPMGLPACPVGW